jgi:hypothetical protein
MDLAFGTGRNQYVTPCIMSLLNTFHLECLAICITTGPGAIAAADGTGSSILHLCEGSGIQSVDQFSRKIGTILKTA